MSTKNTNQDIRNLYSKYNKIRTKLLLFIDNEIRTKMSQSNHHLKYNYNDETQLKISFEETFTQKKNNRHDLYSSNVLKTKQNDNLDKSISTVDISTNIFTAKSQQKNRGNIHSKTLNKVSNSQDKIFNNLICFNKKFYSIKNLSRQSSTFLILPNQKNAAEYLKNLCKNLKIIKSDKKPVRHIKSISIHDNFFNLSKDKKTRIRSIEFKKQKSIKENLHTYPLFNKSQKGNFVTNPTDKKPLRHIKSINTNTKLFDLINDKKITKKSKDKKKLNSKKDNLPTYSLFKKSQKGNFETNSKHRKCGKSTNTIFIGIKQNE